MGGFRPERVAEVIHREVAQRIRTDVKDPRLADLSITRVEVTRDIGRARVLWVPLGGGEVAADIGEALDDAARTLRGPIGRALRLRHAPELVFQRDTHLDAALKVTGLLDRLRSEREEAT
jgi:ribosome-binding factor A